MSKTNNIKDIQNNKVIPFQNEIDFKDSYYDIAFEKEIIIDRPVDVTNGFTLGRSGTGRKFEGAKQMY